MAHKHERQCWDCGSKNMEKLDSYVKCRDCGATWNDISALKAAPMTKVDEVTDESPKLHAPSRYKPRAVRHSTVSKL